MNVNWFSVAISDENGAVTYRNSFITDLPVHRGNAAMTGAGRARWKIENEGILAQPTSYSS
jgi:hypothetical protein